MKAPRASAGLPYADHDGADTVERFAEKNAISRAQAWKELAAGRLIGRKVGARTIITHEDAAAWRRALPKTSAKNAPDTPEANNACRRCGCLRAARLGQRTSAEVAERRTGPKFRNRKNSQSWHAQQQQQQVSK